MIVVTGASGYLGSHITRSLAESGQPVRALVRNRAHAVKEQRLANLPIEWAEGDVTQPDTLRSAFQGALAIVHTVAIAIEKGAATYETINYQGTVNVVDCAKDLHIERLINISQLGADPTLPYRFLASKGKAQAYVAATGLAWTALRPSVIWGPEDEFANTFARLVPFTPLIFPIVGDERSKFQPVWVGDVAASVVKALAMPETVQHEYELGGPEILTLEQIERRTLQAIGAKRRFVKFPMSTLRFVVRMMERLLPAPPVTQSLLELLQVSNVTTANALDNFVSSPRAFIPENISGYMRKFQARQTLAQFLGK